MLKVAIDPGHGMSNRRSGVYDGGCVVSVKGEDGGQHRYEEASLVLGYALTLKYLLAREGIPYFLTRLPPQGESVTDSPLRSRAQRAQEAGCTHLVSLHMNCSEDERAHGFEVLYRDERKDAPLAKRICERMARKMPLTDRGAKMRRDLAILRFAPGPAVLVEIGFLTNEKDRMYMMTREGRISVGEAILESILG